MEVSRLDKRNHPLPKLLGLVLLSTLAGFGAMLWNGHQTPGKDWHYFASFSLLLRSSYLSFHQFPLHDPWVFGGIDFLANPQTRVLSPLSLIHLAIPPYWSELTILILYGLFGMWGGYRLLRYRGTSRQASFLAGFTYINSSWFGLHFAEGHLAYGIMQLFPWILLFFLRLGEGARPLFALLSLLALLILDGGFYAFLFSALLFLAGLASGLIDVRKFWSNSKPHRNFLLLSLLSFCLLAGAKLLPVILMNSTIKPRLDFTNLPVTDVLRIFFHPLQSIYAIGSVESKWRFQEFGCYLGLAGTALIAGQLLLRRGFYTVNRGVFWVLGIFFWIGSGWGEALNPWWILRSLPLINIAHVQSRLFVLMHLAFVILLATAFDRLRLRSGAKAFLLAFLLAEALFVKNYPLWDALRRGTAVPDLPLIRGSMTAGIHAYGKKPDLYFPGDFGTLFTSEPASPVKVGARHEERFDYRGMIYPIRGDGSARLESFTPGRIELTYSARTPVVLEINTHYLRGWDPDSDAVNVSRSNVGLILVDAPKGEGRVTLLYRPDYLPWVAISWLGGALLWLGLLWKIPRNKLSATLG